MTAEHFEVSLIL